MPNYKQMNNNQNHGTQFAISAKTTRLMQAYRAAAELHALLFDYYAEQLECQSMCEDYATQMCRSIGIEGVRDAIFAEIEVQIHDALDMLENVEL